MEDKNSGAGQATLKDVYSISQEMNGKIDEIRDVMNKTYVTKEDFALVKKDVAILMQWRFYFTGLSAGIGAVIALFADQIKQQLFGG